MLTLLVLSRFDESGASSRYRIYQYFNYFQKLGIQVEVKPLFDKTYINQLYVNHKRSIFYLIKKYSKRAIYLLFNKSKFDLVLMDGELFPFVPYFLEKFFLPKRYIIDQDDAIFHTYDSHKLFLIRILLGKKIGKIWKNSQHVIVGNSYMEKYALSFGAKKVSILPTVVDHDQYKPLSMHKKKQKNEIVIGWTGSPITVNSLSFIESALKNVAKKASIRLHVIGATYEITGVNVISTTLANNWSEEEEIRQLNNIDIGIMPLLDAPYQKGKCGFKLIKYMACAKPMVASALGMNLEIVDHAKNGYLATSLEQWEAYLLMLIKNPAKRREFGICGREKMIKEYSLKKTVPLFEEILLHHLRY